MTLRVDPQIQVARPRWRLNVSLLDSSILQPNFSIVWSHLQGKKAKFVNIIQWWEIMAKPQFKQFYINQGKEQQKLKRGLLMYHETRLRELYDYANMDCLIDYEKIKEVKSKIETYREKEVEGIRIRSSNKDLVSGKHIYKYLIAKQKERSQ